MKTYKGRYTPKNPQKYVGDPKNIIYRSLWERTAFRWCDDNEDVVKWASEPFHIPYVCQTDHRHHKYWPDLFLEFREGRKILVEIKPDKETKPPKGTRNTKRLLRETLTYAKNTSKWKAAQSWGETRGIEFQIWSEHSLRSLGMKIL